jgi:hypothetical protein
MTATLTVLIPPTLVGDMAKVHRLEDAGVVPGRAIQWDPSESAYRIELTDEVVSYLLELLLVAAESADTESLPEWRERLRSQLPLSLSPDGTF